MVGHGEESRPSKTVLDSGFHTVDFGFRIQIVIWFSRDLSCIADSKVQDFGDQMQKFLEFRNPESLTYGEKWKGDSFWRFLYYENVPCAPNHPAQSQMVLSKQLKLKINAIDIRIHFNSKE